MKLEYGYVRNLQISIDKKLKRFKQWIYIYMWINATSTCKWVIIYEYKLILG